MPPPPEVGPARPRLCFVGPMHPGGIPSQADTLGALFDGDGWPVRLTSPARRPLHRALAVGGDLLRWRGWVDVVVVNVFSGRAFAHTDLATTVSRRAVVLHLHGGDLPRFASRHRRWVDRVMARGHAIVAPTTYLAEAARTWGFGATVVPNVVDLDRYDFRLRDAPGADAPGADVLWMRAFEPLYRPMLALRAFALLKKERPEATLTMAGPDHGLQTLIRLAVRDMGLEDSVRLPGVLDHEAKRRALGAHDVMLTTSSIDNAPVSVLEAGASGLPVVAAAVGGLPYLLSDGEDALLVADGEVEALAAALERVVTEPGVSARLSANGRVLAERSGWSAVRPQWEAVLAGLPGRR